MKPLRDPKPLVAEFTAWQKMSGEILTEWCRLNWIRYGFKNHSCAYQFMHYWVNHDENLKARKAVKKLHKERPKRRMALLNKYRNVGKLLSV